MKTMMIVLVLMIATIAMAIAAPDFVWNIQYGGDDQDLFRAVEQTPDGGFIAAGSTRSFGAGNWDFYVVKTNSNGDTLWTHTYGGTNVDEAYALDQTSDGGYIFAGRTKSFGAGNYDFYVVKTNSTGNPIWTQTYGGSQQDDGWAIRQTSDGGYIIAGGTMSYGAGSTNVWVIKTNSTGGVVWTYTYGGNLPDVAYAIEQTSDGGYIIAGMTTPTSLSDSNVLLLKLSNSGTYLWSQTFGGSLVDIGLALQITSDGGFVIAGYTTSFGAGGEDAYLIRTDSNGNSLWTRTYGTANNDRAYSVAQTTIGDCGYIITGWTLTNPGNEDLYVVRTDCQGYVCWDRIWGGTSNDAGYDVIQTDIGDYVIAGERWGHQATHAWLLRIGQEGQGNGYVTLLSYGPPNWAYQLHWIDGCSPFVIFTNFCPGTTGYITGNAASSWTMLPNGDGNDGDSIIFIGPLYATVMDTFWLTHPTCGDVITWIAGDSSGAIEGPLPVELTSFVAIAGNCQVQLQWRTESETDNDHFVLYKRAAGTKNFDAITQIPGHGTVSIPQEYNYIDHSVLNGITYEYQISDVDINGRETRHNLTVSATPSPDAMVVSEYALYQNYPNPFNPSTIICFNIKEAGKVSLKIYDLMGREVATLVNTEMSAGSHTVSWDATGLASGIYLYQLNAGDFKATKKLLFLK
jgi:hypothetical protein